jgi:uncharacterized membrane protein YqjE
MASETARETSLGELIRGLLTDVRTLVREEIALARVEIGEQASRARSAALSFGISAASLALGLTFLLVAASLAVADLLNWPVWAGFLMVAAALTLIGLVALATARRHLRAVRIVPEETVSTLKENSEWIATRLSSARR